MSRSTWPARACVLVMLVASLPLAQTACDDDRRDDAPAPAAPATDPSLALCAQLQLGNVVDDAMCPLVQGAGLAPRYAGELAICRRLAIDLNGRIPTWSEVQARCIGKTPAEMVDWFMGRPEYLRVAQRRWADLFEYFDGISWWRYIQRLDADVAALYSDAISYDEFATQALLSPAYLGRFFGEMRVARAFQIFIGRDAHAVEREDLAKLWNIWAIDPVIDPEYYNETFRVVAAANLCMPPLDELLCHSSLYGEREIALDVEPTGDPEDPRSWLVDIDAITPEQWQRLRAPAELMTSLPSFHEHAVAEVMNRYLGWDAAGRLPQALHALTRWFVGEAGGSIRAVERELLLSALYLAPHEPPDNEVDARSGDAPMWRYKPLRQLDVETWMDSIQQMTGASLGWCDHRFAFVQRGYDPDTGQVLVTPHDYPLANPETGEPSLAYAAVARALGGCPDHVGTFRFTGTGAVHALLQEQLIQLLCYHPLSSGLTPGGGFAGDFTLADDRDTLAALYTHQTTALLSRPPADDELEAFVDATERCGAQGSCNLPQLPSQLCEVLTKSAEFLYY